MRIAMIIEAWEPIWGGGQAHVLELSKKLVGTFNCEIDIFVMNLASEKGAKQAQIERINKNLRIIRAGKIRCFNSFKDRLIWIFDVINEIKINNKSKKYDLIHAHANLPAIPAAILKYYLHIPIIYTIHGSGVHSMYDMYGTNLKSYLMLKLEFFLHTKIKYDHEISVDSSIFKNKNKNKNVSIISNGVDIEKYDSIMPEKNNEIFKIIFVGRLHKQKGLSYLIQAINAIKNELNQKTEVHIIGKGELQDELKKQVKELQLSKLIKFRGALFGEQLAREFKSADLFILPSLYEGQPLTLLEAWASKLAVIATDVGDNKKFINNNENGFLVNKKDVDSISKAILKAMKDPHLKRMGENGYNMVKSNYTWGKVAKKTYGIYKEVLQK